MEMRSMQIPLLCLCFVALCSAFQCPPNFTNVNGTCYMVLNTGGTNWFQSRTRCRQIHRKADLATIRCYAEHQWVHTQLKAMSPSLQYAWIGLSGIMNTPDRFWVIEPIPSAANYGLWKSTMPDNHQQIEHCTELYTTNGEWNDNICNRINMFAVCEAPSPDAGGACGNKETVTANAEKCSIC